MEPIAHPRWRLAITALTLALGLVFALRAGRPLKEGDGVEYLLMTEAFGRHHTPELRDGDIAVVAERCAQASLDANFAAMREAYYLARDGRLYCYHFWLYPLAASLLRPALLLLGVDLLRAPMTLNALALAAAVWWAASFPGRRAAVLLPLLTLASPVLFLMAWPHPETFTYALVTIALVEAARGRWTAGVLSSALASTQNPPVAALALVLLVLGLHERWRNGLRAVLPLLAAAAPVALAPAFYLLLFGQPNLIAANGGVQGPSPWRWLELFLDLNVGMLPYVPFALAAAAVAAGTVLRAPRPLPLLCGAALAAAALACTTTTNWNHGTTGPNRYTDWLMPFVFVAAAWAADHARTSALATATCVAAIATQAAIVAWRGGPWALPDYHEHSWAARLVLEHAPSLYRPTTEIFAKRTVGRDEDRDEWNARGSVVYRVEGRCRKALLPTSRAEAGVPACGPAKGRSLAPDEPAWTYLDY